jgi:hypothetical protein
MERRRSSCDKLSQVATNLQNEILTLCVRVPCAVARKTRNGTCSRTGTEPSAMVGVLHNGGTSTRFIYMIDA